MDWKYYLPLLLVITSNVIYHNVTKNTPSQANAFLSLTITYTVSALIGAGCYFASAFLTKSADGWSLSKDLHSVNWTSLALGAAVIGLELGYILMYRCGWEISKGSLIANTTVAVILLAIGPLLYKEAISAKEYMGIFLCISGIIIVNI